MVATSPARSTALVAVGPVSTLSASTAEREALAATVAQHLPGFLSAEQRAAAGSMAPVTVCRAAAGAGKTTVLVHRAAALISAGVPPDRLCLVCFSRAAADVMRQRLAELVGAASAQAVMVTTLHALGRRIAEPWLGPGVSVHPQVAGGDELWPLWRALLRELVVEPVTGSSYAEGLVRWVAAVVHAQPVFMHRHPTMAAWRAALADADLRGVDGRTAWSFHEERLVADWLTVLLDLGANPGWRVAPFAHRENPEPWEGRRVSVHAAADRLVGVVSVLPQHADGTGLGWVGADATVRHVADVAGQLDGAKGVRWLTLPSSALADDPAAAVFPLAEALALQAEQPPPVGGAPVSGWSAVWFPGAHSTTKGLDRSQRGKRLAELLGRLWTRSKTVGAALPDSDGDARVSHLRNLLVPVGAAYEALLDAGRSIPLYGSNSPAPRAPVGRSCDFEDYLATAVGALRVHPELPGRHWSHVLVDEYQDFTPIMERFLAQLVADAGTLFVVGDPRQSIYGFMGAAGGRLFRQVPVFDPSPGGVADRALVHTPLSTSFRLRSLVGATALALLDDPCGELVPGASGDAGFVGLPLVPLGVRLPRPASASALAVGGGAAVTQRRQLLHWILADARERHPSGDSVDPIEVLLLARYHRIQRYYGLAGPSWDAFRELWLARGVALRWLTMHAAKGDEADHVVLLDLSVGQYGFPASDAAEPLLAHVGEWDVGYAEERRLLHVALTRARRSLYLSVGQGPASAFAAQLACVPAVRVLPVGGFRGARASTGSCPQCQGEYWVPRQLALRVCRRCGHRPDRDVARLRAQVAKHWQRDLSPFPPWHPR